MSYTMIDEGVPLLAGNIVLEINRKTLNEPETYLGFETKVKIEDQLPAGERDVYKSQLMWRQVPMRRN